jgi:hypothetical protein
MRKFKVKFNPDILFDSFGIVIDADYFLVEDHIARFFTNGRYQTVAAVPMSDVLYIQEVGCEVS